MAIAIGLCVIGQLGNVGHQLLVQHSICPDHGEVVHSQGQLAHQATTLPDDINASSLSRTTDSDGDEHEHCIAVVERRRFVSNHPGWEASSHHTDVTPTLGTDPISVSGRYRLLQAPKTSPPA